MTGEPMTEREAILAARVKELEAAAQAQIVSVAKGGVFEATWHTINAIIPTWLAAVALAVFLAHFGFIQYIKAQIIDAETALKAAKADVEKAQSDAANGKIGDEPMRLATLKAELSNKQAEAARAKAEARAQAAQVDGETTRLTTLKAQLANVQNQATLARAKADAESAKFGLRTLEDRAVRAKLILQQFALIDAKDDAARKAAVVGEYWLSKAMYDAVLRAQCEDNQFAELIGCPAQFVHRIPATAAHPDETPKSVQPTTIANGWPIYKGFGFDDGVGRKTSAPSFEVCGDICAREAQCKVFTFYPTGQQCRLLASHGSLKSYAGAISAVKPDQKTSTVERDEPKTSDDLPPATAQSARTPPAFDCSKAFFGVEFVICSSPQLVEAEARLEDAYHAARNVRGDDEIKYQRAWYTKIFGTKLRTARQGAAIAR